MPKTRLFALAVLPLLTAGCVGWLPQKDKGPPVAPNPPVYCYETLGRAACYDQPQLGLGDLINAQVPPIVVAPAPVVVTPAVPTPAQIKAMPDTLPVETATTIEEPPIIIRNPDPYPEP